MVNDVDWCYFGKDEKKKAPAEMIWLMMELPLTSPEAVIVAPVPAYICVFPCTFVEVHSATTLSAW